MTVINLGLMLMGYGLGGVFATLILFYCMIKLMTKIASGREDKD